MTARIVCVCGAVMLLCAGVDARTVVGSLYGHDVFWMEPAMRLDTLHWYGVERTHFAVDSTERHIPEEATALFADSGMQLFELKDLTAMSVAILKDRGYTVAFLAQWNATPSQYIDIYGNVEGTTNADYERRRIVTDFIWEVLEAADVGKPSKLGGDYTVTLRFEGNGWSRCDGKEDVCKHVMQLATGGEAVHLRFVNDMEFELAFSRRLYRAVLVAPAGKKPSRIISELEGVMDALKLDLSYKVPKVTAIE